MNGNHTAKYLKLLTFYRKTRKFSVAYCCVSFFVQYIILKERIRRVKLETVHLTSMFLVWKCEYIALIDNFGLNFFLLFSSF